MVRISQKYGKASMIHINGYGSKRNDTMQSGERFCGLPAFAFARLLHFFDIQLKINLLGVQTCH